MKTLANLSVLALLFLAACPNDVPNPAKLHFHCDDKGKCPGEQVCFEDYCVDPSQIAADGGSSQSDANGDAAVVQIDSGPRDLAGHDAVLLDAEIPDQVASDIIHADAAGTDNASSADATALTDHQISDAGTEDSAQASDANIAEAAIADGYIQDATSTDIFISSDAAVPDTSIHDAQMNDSTISDTSIEDSFVEDSAMNDAAIEDAASLDAGQPDTAVNIEVFADNPLNQLDNTTNFSFVFAHVDESGHKVVVMGPSGDGTGAVRMWPDGTNITQMHWQFNRDPGTGESSSNTCNVQQDTDIDCSTTYPSIGYTGCNENSPECGPDNENGRGLFLSTTINDVPWLIIGGTHSNKNPYVYMSTDTNSSPHFSYIDFSDVLGGSSQGLVSMAVWNDKLFLGYIDGGGGKPFLLRLSTTPTSPGLDVDKNASYIFKLNKEGITSEIGGHLGIDQIIEFNGYLYLFNAGGCAHSSSTTADAPWQNCTPSASAYTAAESYEDSETLSDLIPADRAFAGATVYKDHLYVGRNTNTDPQIWVCPDPNSASPFPPGQACGPGDWANIPLPLGDDLMTGAPRFSLVESTAQSLYIGFDTNLGAVLFRNFIDSRTQVLSSELVDGPGFGDPTARTKILSSAIIDDEGQDYLFIVSGNGENTPSVLRVWP